LTTSLIFSDGTWFELISTISRKRFDRYMPVEQRRRFLADLRPREMTVISRSISVGCDPTDNKFLETGIAGNAAFLVTGDSDLLSIAVYEPLQIVSPAQYLELSPVAE